MIVVDTSAVMRVLQGEPASKEVESLLVSNRCVMAAPTRVELGLVVEARSGSAGSQLLEELLDRVGVDVVPFDAALANEAIIAWRRFGKGRHPAGLNLGDTYSYALARRLGCPLLFIGDDFSKTDVLTPERG